MRRDGDPFLGVCDHGPGFPLDFLPPAVAALPAPIPPRAGGFDERYRRGWPWDETSG